MYTGKLVFSQVMDHLPLHLFRECVQRYEGDRYIKSFSCLSQFYCMAFAQLSYRESLRDIEVCLRAQHNKLYHMGIRGTVSRNTLANANMRRNWRIHAEFAHQLIRIARPLYADEDLGLQLDNTVYALDASTVDLCLSLFPWALFRSTKSAVKLHTLLDLQGNIPAFIHVSDGKLGDVKVLDILVPEPGAFYIMDRAYLDFMRLNCLDTVGAFFIRTPVAGTMPLRRERAEADRRLTQAGTTENAVKTQIWIAVAVYVLVAIVKKRLDLDASLYTILQTLSLTLFEKTPVFSMFSQPNIMPSDNPPSNQLILFDF